MHTYPPELMWHDSKARGTPPRRGRLRLPLHIPRSDQSPEANQQRYMLAIAAAEMNPKGFRQIGKKSGVTKRRRRNRLECLGRSIA